MCIIYSVVKKRYVHDTYEIPRYRFLAKGVNVVRFKFIK